MAEWVSCSGRFIEADVIRWHERIWHKLRRRRDRNVSIGERVVTAEVIEDRDGFVRLLVRDCRVVLERTSRRVPPLPTNTLIRRNRRTIERGKPERLLWSDESARTLLLSRFLGLEKTPPS